MYNTFTGSSRRPRQVDLSGRRTNPFATGPSGGPQSAIQNAQHDRQQRQRQREELAAAKNLQRVWRGYSSRKRGQQLWRERWDGLYAGSEGQPFTSEDEALANLRLLLGFVNHKENDDIQRLLSCCLRLSRSNLPDHKSGPWPVLYLRLEKVCLKALERLVQSENAPSEVLEDLSDLLSLLVRQVDQQNTVVASDLFRTIALVFSKSPSLRQRLLPAVREILQTPRSSIYTGFAAEFLTRPQSPDLLQSLVDVVHRETVVEASNSVATRKLDVRSSLWLLGQVIALMSPVSANSKKNSGLHSAQATQVIGRLLASVADSFDIEATPIQVDNYEYDARFLSGKPSRIHLNPFLKTSLSSLIDQSTIRRVLDGYQASTNDTSTELATYVLTLLRVFYSHADDIRMWLYLGSPDRATDQQDSSPIAFFWREARKSSVVQSVMNSARAAITLIVNRPLASSWQAPGKADHAGVVADEWKVILIFLELYTFVLKLMDDEEFLGQTVQKARSRSNPLSLDEIAELVTFLKHLGFSMYYHAQQISNELNPHQEPLSRQSLSRHFGASQQHGTSARTDSPQQQVLVAGLPGVSLDYVKGIVTGLVRSIYERDSRRNFLRKGHWLMTSEFDMSNFISDVVAEEESRHQIQEMEDEDGGNESEDETDVNDVMNMNSHIRRIMDVERKQKALRKASRRRYLESVAPRLEILQNMPFLIPFDTRVQIFREFVRLDQMKRRNGFVDPDIWRHSLIMGHTRRDAEHELSRHHAKVRRKHEFQDAMDSFFDLGSALKEPIQITFVDEFDMVEAGIDGGGVTKEFITSATAQAFNPDFNLFKSNDQHLLYPNPTAIDEVKEGYKEVGKYGSEEYREDIKHLLDSYEFAGRVIGKCLYEGILVDISFAGFFLVKWALTGTSGFNPQESGYRANINDLRDLDEELYQGLLSLKNYQGNVEDLALTFSINDEIPLKDGRVKTIERELIPDGANIPVTNANRLVYISRVARYRLQGQSSLQNNAFLKGLASIVQPSWLAMFNQSEIQNLVGGAASSIDIEDLRRNTIYSGLYVIGDDNEEHPVIKLFWKALHEFSDEDRGKVLKFVTSTPRAPLLGFSSLNPKFSIRDSGEDESRFPTTSTCINLLKLPRYKSKQALKEKLLYAVNSGAGFDLS
ncbi:putative E3 ubiquitin protein ligase [Elsinoe australis]|uniref:HECT-type E3 ubiquitin transferase n=1 Tax=Elsinoe australis TaxID=40998 RepID=A0A4U7AZI0_9PEZI|nr:putative E3 ubiquitin protein ligase [Elsinoe australis]